MNRFGASPLFECMIAAKMDSIKLLLHSGARVDLKDNDGTTCWDLAANFPKMIALISEAGTEAARKTRAEKKSEGAFKCGASGCGKRGSKRCTGCYLIYFCSGPCFKEAWPTHKTYRKRAWFPTEFSLLFAQILAHAWISALICANICKNLCARTDLRKYLR